jgi:putative aldouronate transport system substrate-binding protein
LPPAKVSWYVVNSIQPDTQQVVDKVNELLAAKTSINTTLDFQVIDWGTYGDKMSLMVQSGEPFDLMYASSWINLFNVLAGNGSLQPLDDLLSSYGQDITRQVDQRFFDSMKFNGKIYGVPNVQGYAQRKGLTFKADLVDKYGFDYKSIKSVADVEPYLQTILENEPELVPFLPGTDVFSMYPPTGNPPEGLAYAINYYPEDSSLKLQYEDESYVKYLQKLHDWYQKGFIAKDAASTDKQNWGDQIRTGLYAVVPNFAYVNDGLKSTADYGFRCYDIALYTQSPIRTAMVQVGESVISTTSKQPDRAMMLLNAVWADKEIFNTLCFGIEGVHWNWKDKDAELIEITDKGNSGYTAYINYQLGSTMNIYGKEGQTREDIEADLALNDNVPASALMGFTYDSEVMKNEGAAITSIQSEVAPLLDSGTYDPDVELPKFKQRLIDAGWEAVKDDCKRQIDEWKAANGK